MAPLSETGLAGRLGPGAGPGPLGAPGGPPGGGGGGDPGGPPGARGAGADVPGAPVGLG